MQKARRSSEILNNITSETKTDEALSFGEIIKRLGERTFGLGLIFFALPAALPFSVIPGISFVFSLPIVFIAIQMIMARKSLWIPPFLSQYAISCSKVNEIINKTIPYLTKIERLLKPRLVFMCSRIMEIITGIVILLLAFLLMLPIPFSNFILASLIIVFSLGWMEKDGLFILLGYLVTAIYIELIYWFIYTTIKALFNI